MKAFFDTEPSAYEASGNELRIRWDIKEVPAPSMDDEPRTQWSAEEAVCNVFDNRAALISGIIRSKYSVDAEFAAINNQSTKPEEYAEYQSFRVQAKLLADGWMLQE
jgi:predicted Mrr-cat superfamily restriction endonuclease